MDNPFPFATAKAKDAQRMDFAHPAASALPRGVKPVAKSPKPASKSQ